MEPSNTGSQNLGSDEGGDTSSHVHDSRSSEIMHSTSEEGVSVEGGDPSRRRPDRIDDNGVDESREHKTVSQVGLELATFGYSTGNCDEEEIVR